MKYPKTTLVVCVFVMLAVLWIRWDSITGAKPLHRWRDEYIDLLQKEDYLAIRQRLGQAERVEKLGCILALSQVPLSEEAKPVVKILAQDQSEMVRDMLAAHLSELPPEMATYTATLLADDPDASVKERVQMYLEEKQAEK